MCTHSCSTFLKGMALGILAGVGVVIAGKIAIDNNKRLSKGTDKISKAVDEFVDGIQSMMR